MTPSPASPVDVVARIALEVAGPAADAVDREARFPQEAIDALKRARMLGALVGRDAGGLGCGLVTVGAMCEVLAQHCAATAMVFAMHQIQVASILRHASAQPYFAKYLADLAECQYLIASATSEVGIGGELRRSACAVVPEPHGRFALEKDCTTVSYGSQADDILLQARRDPASPPNDQVCVLVHKREYSLEQRGGWDTLGMRGTCSPPFLLKSAGDRAQVLPTAFADIAADTQVPYSHVLWSHVWLGIAMSAVGRARAFVRQQARATPGVVPPTALRLAEAACALQAMRNSVHAVAGECESAMSEATAGQRSLSTIAFALRLNNLKVTASQMVVSIVQQALSICGILGYKNDSRFALGRHLRDAHSAALMVANDRIYAANASMLLVLKDE